MIIKESELRRAIREILKEESNSRILSPDFSMKTIPSDALDKDNSLDDRQTETAILLIKKMHNNMVHILSIANNESREKAKKMFQNLSNSCLKRDRFQSLQNIANDGFLVSIKDEYYNDLKVIDNEGFENMFYQILKDNCDLYLRLIQSARSKAISMF